MAFFLTYNKGNTTMDAFYGEIRAFPYGFEPQDWMLCDGRQLQIQMYQPLFVIIGTRFGGDGKTTFNLPDLRGLAVTYTNNQASFGKAVGTTTATLNLSQMPAHTHTVQGMGGAVRQPAPNSSASFINPLYVSTAFNAAYPCYDKNVTSPAKMSPVSVGGAGNGLPLDIRQPYLSMGYFICVVGAVFPIWP